MKIAIASTILTITALSYPGAGISATIIFLFITGAVGWILYALSAMKVKQLKSEIEMLHIEVKDLQQSHDDNLKKIRALESSLRNACLAIDKLTAGMDRINKMFDDDEDATLG